MWAADVNLSEGGSAGAAPGSKPGGRETLVLVHSFSTSTKLYRRVEVEVAPCPWPWLSMFQAARWKNRKKERTHFADVCTFCGLGSPPGLSSRTSSCSSGSIWSGSTRSVTDARRASRTSAASGLSRAKTEEQDHRGFQQLTLFALGTHAGRTKPNSYWPRWRN